jgi:CVNH domain
VKMKLVLAALALAGLAGSAYAQALPPGSYQQSCRDFRMRGSTLTALCRRANGRGEQLTGLNVSRCVGDIGNNNGNLVCNGGQPLAPAPPTSRQGTAPEYQGPGYQGPGYQSAPGYPSPGYGPPPRYGEEQAYRERCEGLGHEEHELRHRLAGTPYGEERERLQYRLGQVHAEREQCWRR